MRVSIMMHLYYTGKNGAARSFAREMEDSGTADRIRAERYVTDAEGIPPADAHYIRE